MKPFLASATAACAFVLASCGGSVNAADTTETAATTAVVSTIEVEELAALMVQDKVLLIDVRTPREFAETRISGSLNAPVQTFVPAMIPQEKERETILYCRSDPRSGVAAEQLAAHLNRPVRHLAGGILAWQEAGLPTETQPD